MVRFEPTVIVPLVVRSPWRLKEPPVMEMSPSVESPPKLATPPLWWYSPTVKIPDEEIWPPVILNAPVVVMDEADIDPAPKLTAVAEIEPAVLKVPELERVPRLAFPAILTVPRFVKSETETDALTATDAPELTTTLMVLPLMLPTLIALGPENDRFPAPETPAKLLVEAA